MVGKSEHTEGDIQPVDLIPARMVNEVAYCPRLYYLEHVQGEWAHNADTLEGRLVHRRVDKEGGKIPEAGQVDPDTKLHARSVLVSSSRLGAIARVDVMEGEGGRVVPVDYKRGSAPDLPEGAWEPERVQVCLQGLLLRDNGYTCDEGVLYFAGSRTRVAVPLTEALEARTLALVQLTRTLGAEGIVPPPLDNSPKCVRCSLAAICLPDEVSLLRHGYAVDGREDPEEGEDSDTSAETEIEGEEAGSGLETREVRRLLAARDDRIPLYVQGQGFSIGLKAEELEVREKGRKVDSVRLMDVSQVSLFGNVQLSAQALRELADRGVIVTHLSYGGWVRAVTQPMTHRNIELRLMQYEGATDPVRSLALARAFVAGKIRNCRTLLRRNGREVPEEVLEQLRRARQKTARAESLSTLLGIEGSAARVYFSAFSSMFKTESEEGPTFDFTSRNRRPPRDPVNALLSFVYSMLVKDWVATLIGVGLDPYLGFYHQPRYGRPALALDLMEEFRPLVGDSVVIGLINNGEVQPSDFVYRAGACALSERGRKRLIDKYERRMDQLVTHPIFRYSLSYRRVLEVQARLLGRFLTGEIEEYPPFCTR